MRDLINVVFVDPELGPTEPEVRLAAAHAQGRPGALTSALSATREGRGASWVHETGPEYVTRGPSAFDGQVRCVDRRAGVGRLIRAVDAAIVLAARGRHARAVRVLARAAEGLEARGPKPHGWARWRRAPGSDVRSLRPKRSIGRGWRVGSRHGSGHSSARGSYSIGWRQTRSGVPDRDAGGLTSHRRVGARALARTLWLSGADRLYSAIGRPSCSRAFIVRRRPCPRPHARGRRPPAWRGLGGRLAARRGASGRGGRRRRARGCGRRQASRRARG